MIDYYHRKIYRTLKDYRSRGFQLHSVARGRDSTTIMFKKFTVGYRVAKIRTLAISDHVIFKMWGTINGVETGRSKT